jgi:two-component system chemotaxis response regulator CheB
VGAPRRILIVDDSAVMRSLLRTVVSSDHRLEVVGTANDGVSALRALAALTPDLVVLDVEMPGMDGVATLKAIRGLGAKSQTGQVPVIMCSSLTQRGAKVTIDALACGASDYVAKPSGAPSREQALKSLVQDLVPKILALTDNAGTAARPPAGPFVNRGKAGAFPDPAGTPPLAGGSAPAPLPTTIAPLPSSAPAVVVVGVSTGGPAALDVLLPALPADFPLPVLVVQHMPPLFTRLLAERLDSASRLRVSEAEDGQPVRAGHIYIARGDWHMETAAGAGGVPALRLTQTPPEHHCRPAADVLFRSAARVFGPRVLAVVLTGMGSDGLDGCRLIRELGGWVVVQDAATSAVWGMPGAVAEAGLAQRVLPIKAMASEILRLCGRSQREAFALRDSVG